MMNIIINNCKNCYHPKKICVCFCLICSQNKEKCTCEGDRLEALQKKYKLYKNFI